MPDETQPTAVIDSPAPTSAPQATDPTTQVAAQPQSVTPTQVEPGARLQTRDEVRPFERVAGRKFDKLERGMQGIMDALQKLQQPACKRKT